jgi:hypothetical protein
LPDDSKATFIGLAGDRSTVADLLHLLGCDVVASNMANVPGIPDEAADDKHRIL